VNAEQFLLAQFAWIAREGNSHLVWVKQCASNAYKANIKTALGRLSAKAADREHSQVTVDNGIALNARVANISRLEGALSVQPVIPASTPMAREKFIAKCVKRANF
jgi:hypothetical protein